MMNQTRLDDSEVDRREVTVVTQEPGFASTEQVVRDVAAERRMEKFQINRIIWNILAFLEILLAFRFVLRLIAANPDSGFAMIMYGITGIFVWPFNGLIATPTSGGTSLELTTLIAMGVYALIFWGFVHAIWMIADLSIVRTFTTRSTREQTRGAPGNVRTTHTVSNRKSW